MEQVFLNLLEVSLGASAVILLMLLVAPLAGRTCSAKWRYWVWLLLAIRLILPFNVDLPSAALTVTVPEQLTQTVEVALPETGDVEVVPAVSEEGKSDGSIVLETQPLAPEISVETKALWRPSPLEMLALVWAAGAVASLIWQGVAYARYQQSARLWNRPVTDEVVLGIYEELCMSMKLRNIPQLLHNRRNQSPMMIGLLKPAILLPEISYSEEDYEVILSHELNHYRRHDLWYKLLLVAARCVHWFNPLVWRMLREAENDLEITCDEAVVKNSDSDERAQYCEAILRIMCRGKGGYALLSTGFNGGKKVLQRRFTAVLNEKASRGVVLGALALVLVLLCGALVACEVRENSEPVTEPPVAEEEVEEETPAIPQTPPAEVEKETAEEVPPEAPSEETAPEPVAPTAPSTPAVSVPSGSGSNSGAPFKLSFRGLDVHATEAYETVNYYTTDSAAIGTILEALDWEGKQAVPAKQELHTHDIELSGNYVRFITDNMEQLYIYQDYDQALYRDFAGNRTYYNVDERAYDEIFGLAQEISQWKRNPVTDERVAPFNENYTTLDISSSEFPEKLTYSLTIRTFCEMLIDDMNWSEIAEKTEVSDYLSPVDLSDGHYLRISTDTGRHLYLYKEHPYGVYYTGHGVEHYYKLPSGTYQRVLKLLEGYSMYQKPGAKRDVFPFQRDFTSVTVSLQDKCLVNVEPEAVALDQENSFRMMAGIPTGYFVRAEKKEELSLEEGVFVLMENADGQKLAIYEGKSQAKYWAADGKVAYYELGADYYDIAKMVANECVRKQRGTPLDAPSKLNPETAKPVIYLYPEEEMEVSIQLDYNGQLTTTYPSYNDGWMVTAKPDGTIIDPKGREYYCLFWEGISNVDYDLSSGFVMEGGETEAFLETALKQLGLTDKEANEFLIYWLPKMENNPYNLISFQQKTYTDNAVLDIQPQPDSLLRVFMAWKALDEAIDIPAQELPSFQRRGFTVVEWGGSEM